MRYRFHDGIVYTRISSVYLLVATRKAWDIFPAVKLLSPIFGWFASGIAAGMSIEEIKADEGLNRKLKKEAIDRKMKEFIDVLTKENYLIMEEESAES